MELSNLGFIFELGFNIGMVSFFKEEHEKGRAEMKKAFLPFVQKYLSSKEYKKENIYVQYTKDIIDENTKDIIKKNIDYLLFKGILCGKNFVREFIAAKVGDKSFKLEYFQANFYDCLNKKDNDEEEKNYYKQLVEQQLDIVLNDTEAVEMMKKGETFKADSIFLIAVKEKYHLCIVDNGIALKNIKDHSNIQELKNIYKRTIFNKRTKSNFSNLALDSEGAVDLNLNESLTNYILAMHKKDKPLFKMIQAGSYGYSFISLLQDKNYLKEDQLQSVCIAGYTDEEISSINLSRDNMGLFADINKSYREILSEFNKSYKGSDRTNRVTALDEKINGVFARLRTNFKTIFNLKDDFKTLINLTDGINYRQISESFERYQNTAGPYKYNGSEIGFRTAHASEITKYIRDKNYSLLFLTGNPGIGKTTAIVNYLKEQESYIFIYVSPRIQVNKDIEVKFSVSEGTLYNDEAIYLTANGNDETFIDGQKVNIVNFTANKPNKFKSVTSPIKFMENSRIRDFSRNRTKFNNRTSKEFSEADNDTMGVLNRLTQAINHIIDNSLSNKVIATSAVQSLKSIAENKTTARHFKNIFKTVINEKVKSVDESAFAQFAKKYKNVVFMIDEITGDESGVQFLQELMNIVFTQIYNKLSEENKKKVNFKIIVADASVTDIDVIQKHLSSKENDSDKIYYKVKNGDNEPPLEVKDFKFRDKFNSVYINTNSYPAKKLDIDYKLYIKVKEIMENEKLFDNNIRDEINEKLAEDAIDAVIKGFNKQVIVYIQDIKRIDEVTTIMKTYYKEQTGREFIINEDYVQINSSISERQREQIFRVKDKVKVVLMTSSASRGISFPNTTLLLVDMPKFDIEKNIMEILQLVYRGRGDEVIDTTMEKKISFYIGDTIYYKDNREEKIKESMISLMTLLIILKASILTRINGFGQIGKNNIALVPIGGKGISGNEDMLIETISSLMRNIRKEINKAPSNKNLKDMLNDLMNIFSSIKVQTDNCIYKDNISSIVSGFYSKWSQGVDELLDYSPYHDIYMIGDIAIFKLTGEVQSDAELLKEIVLYNLEKNKTLERLFAMAENDYSLPDTLRNEMRKAADTLYYFKKISQENSVKLVDKSSSMERFVAMPLIGAFVTREFEEYYKTQEEEETFKDILEAYVKAYYKIGNTLPITDVYRGVPFIAFKSGSLLNMRRKIFNERYMFCSSEVNLLNLILMK